MGIYSELDIQIQELEMGIDLARLENTTEELQTLDFDTQNHTDDSEWWRDQDAEMEAEEMAAIERKAEIQEYRTMGYGE